MPLSLEGSLALQKNFAAHIRSPDTVAKPSAIDDERMQVYRDLFFNSVKSFLNEAFPQLKKLMGDKWVHLQRSFYRDYFAQSPYFHRISSEFLNYLQTATPIEPSLIALAEYEQALFDVEVLQIEAAQLIRVNLTPQTPLTLKAGVSLKVFEYDVAQMITAEKWHDVLSEKVELPQFYAFYKSTKGKVQALVLAPMTMALLELFQNENTPLDAFLHLSEMTSMPVEQLSAFGFEFIQAQLNKLVVPVVCS